MSRPRPRQPRSDVADLYAEFSAQFVPGYRTVVAQLYVVTLDAGKAREIVEEVYPRAWRQWSTIRDLPDSLGWVRNAALRASRQSWRRSRGRNGTMHPDGPRPPDDQESRTLLAALGALGVDERRSLVLYHVVGLPVDAIANLEQVAVSAIQAQLAHGHNQLLDAMAEIRDGRLPEEQRLAAMYAWDERKAVALRTLVDGVARTVVPPDVSQFIRRGGPPQTATAAAVIAVVAVGALGGVTLAVQALNAAGPDPVAQSGQVSTPPSSTMLAQTPVVAVPPKPPPRIRAPRPAVTRTTAPTTPTTTEETTTTASSESDSSD